jgi:alkylation response protein AidB-like acyl-CoA dehydrogenase
MIDLDLSPDELLLATTVRGWFDSFADNSYLNAQEGSELGYEPHRWKEISQLGWSSINIPERAGGAGATLAEAAIIARELGRAAYAAPLLSTMRAATVLADAPADPRSDAALVDLAAGAPAALVAPPDRTLTATSTGGGGFRLTGRPVVVEWLEAAAAVVLVLPVLAGGQWLYALVSPGDLSGRVTPVPSTDNERAARLDLDGFELGPDGVLAQVPGPQAQYALARANLLRASLMVGGCESVLERTARYAKEREQFGQPIGAFQAVRHHLARMAIATDAARLACNDALVRATPDAQEPAIAAVALFAAGRSYVQVVLTAAQVHGGVGTTAEHVLHHHFRRAKAMQLRSGRRAARLREIHDALTVRGEGSLW